MLPAPPELLEQAEHLAPPAPAAALLAPPDLQEAPDPPGRPAILAQLDLAALAQLVLRALRVPPGQPPPFLVRLGLQVTPDLLALPEPRLPLLDLLDLPATPAPQVRQAPPLLSRVRPDLLGQLVLLAMRLLSLGLPARLGLLETLARLDRLVLLGILVPPVLQVI